MGDFKIFDLILNENFLNQFGVKTRDKNKNYLSEEDIFNNLKYAYISCMSQESRIAFLILAVKTFDYKELKSILEK